MTTDDKILENDIQYMLRGCDPHDAEARRHIARCIIAYVREHDGRDTARMKWLADYMVEIEYEPTPEETVCIWLLMNKELRRERYETSDLRAAIDAAMRAEG